MSRLAFLLIVVLIACGETNTAPQTETDMMASDAFVAFDLGIEVDQSLPILDAAVTFADQGLLPCDPPLNLTSNTSAARAFDLVRLVPSGGTGQWTFSLIENTSGGSVNRETGVYLAGSNVGGLDRVALSDDGCTGGADFAIEVVMPMLISPSNPQVAPTDILRFDVTGGSGQFAFELLNETSSSVTENGVFVTGPDLGWTCYKLLISRLRKPNPFV